MDDGNKRILDKLKSVDEEYKFYLYLFRERTQLYGLAIILMDKLKIDKISISKEELVKSNKYILNQKPLEDGVGLEIFLTDNNDPDTFPEKKEEQS